LLESKYEYRTYVEGDEDRVRELLKRNLIPTDWKWKYLHNPSFNPSLVVVAEENGKIVGCDHWLLRDIKLSSSSVGRVIFCADIVVDSNHRRRGIGESLVRFLRRASLSNARGAVLSYAFTSLELNERLFQPTAGYVPLETSTVTYCRRWSWKQFIRRVQGLNMKTDVAGKFKFVFHVLGAPSLTIALNQGRIEVLQGDVEGAVVTIKSDLATLGHLKRKERRMRELIKALLTGRVRVSGSLSGIIRLYQNLHLIEEIFRIAL
jgi:GNAT superfamily N-acetyltransferase